ncbi:MAG TPA: tRNA (guanosine(37)-N1)-methyltransferase TrmD [Pirellulaceae bacterium]|nr:tRNA (guanosine(37)-N1)-methyltransferase TrmD [Pirellulaceae bacterium]
MRFDVLTLFPAIFGGYLGQSLLKKAIDAGLVNVQLHDIRAWSNDKHNKVDDRPFGGGPGMILRVEPVVDCVEAVRQMAQPPQAGKQPPGHLILLSPQGRRLDQTVVEELVQQERLLLLCGRYEGFDQRVIDVLAPDEISIGDYILNGGEVAAMAVIDAVIRLVPGVLGDEESSQSDSFSAASRLLEFPQYTRPREYRGIAVPDVLLSGNHQEIARWRQEQSYLHTRRRRADLLPPPDEPQIG